MITALLVDDEPRATARLASLLERSGLVEVIGTAASVDDAERFLRGRMPDAVFLDIDMPGRQGVDLVASIPAGTQLVFVTAHEGHAVEAFRQGAADYILKPFDEARLAITLGRLGSAASGPPPAPSAPGQAEHAVRLSFDGGRRVEIVPLAEVAWIEAVQNYSRVQAARRLPGQIRRSMRDWEARLHAEQGFHRLDRSLIIHLPALRSTQWQSRDQTLLFFADVADPLPVGRTAAARVRELLDAR